MKLLTLALLPLTTVWAATNQDLQFLLEEACTTLTGSNGSWDCSYEQQDLMILTSTGADRMRVMTVVGSATDADTNTLLEANFDRALDARFALHDEHVYAAYLHPLASLTADQFKDALAQVTQLAKTYGTTYASSGLHFVGRSQPVVASIQKTTTPMSLSRPGLRRSSIVAQRMVEENNGAR